MIEIKIPKEITEYKEKLMFGLTVRQLISVVAALAVCVPLYIFGKDYLSDDVVGWIIMIIAIPIFAFGFFKYDGMPFEQFLLMLYRQKWVEPQKRKYEELTIFWICREELIKEEIAHQNAEFTHNYQVERSKTDVTRKKDSSSGEKC